MNSIVQQELRMYLRNRLHYDPYDCGTIIEKMNYLARMAGHELDFEFRHAGLGAGPEARVAAGVIDLALGGGGCETTEYTIRQHLDKWVRENPTMGL